MPEKPSLFRTFFKIILLCIFGLLVFLIAQPRSITVVSKEVADKAHETIKKIVEPKFPALDKEEYDRRLLELANLPPPKPAPSSTNTGSSTAPTATSTPRGPWPVKAPYPNAGAILPFSRVIAYYGNLYSKQMGALGAYPEEQMLAMLGDEVRKWQVADPGTPTIPALHYIVVTAQGSAGEDGKYRLRMPTSQIDLVIAMAKKINALVFLDVQVGLSNVQQEIPLLEDYLKLPQVHLGIDPEFSMKTGKRPGTVIGTMDATDVNFAAEYLAKLVRDNNLPPKMLVVHRFTQPMLTNYRNIRPLPEVQIIIDADGFGSAAQKIGTYNSFIAAEPVQFTGFKLFYKNDPAADHLMTPQEVLRLQPRPSYIQYQ